MAAQKRVDNKRRILKEGESQLPDGRYRYRYFDMDGCRQVVYSWKLVERDRMPPGKKDDLSLREKERQIERDMEDSIKTGRDAKITLNQMFETYMTGKISLKQSTRTNYIYMYTHYVQDGFGKKLLKDIRYSDVKAFYNSLIVEKGFKANSMEIINTLIHPALTLAVRDGYIRFNPSDGVMMEIKKSHQWEKTHRHALTIEEQSAFLNYIASNEQYKHWLPMFTLFLGTGCRVGEIVGLRWEDCDFKQRIMVLQAQSQLKALYKDNMDTIIGNCDASLFLGGKEETTLKSWNSLLGKETIDLYNTSVTKGNQESHGQNFQKLGKDLMSVDELAVMDGGKCLLQIRGVRPFLSRKYDITKHPNYKLLSDFNEKNAFNIEKFLSTRMPMRPGERYRNYEVTAEDLASQTL